MHKPAFSHLKLQDIIFIIQHGQMNILLNTFPIAIVRQLDIGTISGDYGILPGIRVKLTIRPSSLNTLNVLLGFKAPGTSGISDT